MTRSKRLGEGSQGSVWLGTYGSQEVAIKSLKGGPGWAREQLASIQKEAQIQYQVLLRLLRTLRFVLLCSSWSVCVRLSDLLGRSAYDADAAAAPRMINDAVPVRAMLIP